MQRYIPQSLFADYGVYHFADYGVYHWVKLLRKRVSDSGLDKLRHRLPLLDGRDLRSPVHLNIKR